MILSLIYYTMKKSAWKTFINNKRRILMRNFDTPVKQIRRKIFTEIAKIGFESTDESLIHDIESIPYNIVEERAK